MNKTMFNKLDKLLVYINNESFINLNRNFVNESKKFNLLQKILHVTSLLFKTDSSNVLKPIWLINETTNNIHALTPLKTNKSAFIRPNKDIIYRYSLIYKLIYFIPLFFYIKLRNRLKWYFDYIKVVGHIEESRRILRKYKPEKLVFSNDHNPYQIALKLAAQELAIPTYYFQHASISNSMPPLDFTVSFLEGDAALDKYKEIGDIKGKVELIGNLRLHNKNIGINTSSKVDVIGIAANKLDKTEDIYKLIEHIVNKYTNISIVLRLHPADNRKIIVKNKNVHFSDSNLENTFVFLRRIDMLIAGDSSIHLEAALVNVIPVYYKISINNIFDYYGYYKNGLVYYAKNIKSLDSLIEMQTIKKLDVQANLAYYDEFFKRKFDYKDVLKKYGLI